MENSISSDLIRGHIDTIILQTISSADKNSQEILDDISSSSDGKYELKQPTLYSSLKRLESDGFIKSFWRDAEDGRRKFYHLTDKGRALVRKNLNDWKFSRAVIDSLVKAEPDVRTEIVYKEVPMPKRPEHRKILRKQLKMPMKILRRVTLRMILSFMLRIIMTLNRRGQFPPLHHLFISFRRVIQNPQKNLLRRRIHRLKIRT